MYLVHIPWSLTPLVRAKAVDLTAAFTCVRRISLINYLPAGDAAAGATLRLATKP
jgi:hypothetical protein